VKFPAHSRVQDSVRVDVAPRRLRDMVLPCGMQSALNIVFGALALSVLIIMHELGHFLVARAFGMRARIFSIGFGPVVARWRPRGGDTMYQIAAIPLLAYVSIAGMDPREPHDPHDRGSYKNASLLARFFVLAGGPLANYLVAMVIVFGSLAFGGEPNATPQVREVVPDSAAQAAGIRAGDRVVRVADTRITSWPMIVQRVSRAGGQPLEFEVERAGQRLTLSVTPRYNASMRSYKAGIAPAFEYVPVPYKEAALRAMVEPAHAAVAHAKGFYGMIFGRDKVQLMGPVRIVNEMANEARHGWRPVIQLLWLLSVGLFFLNLLPIPALDGGKAVFIAYEALFRRKLPPRFEYSAVAYTMVPLLCLGAVFFVYELFTWH
jgi:regulator of sigma E protease